MERLIEAQILIGKKASSIILEMLLSKSINLMEQNVTINGEKFTLIIKRGSK